MDDDYDIIEDMLGVCGVQDLQILQNSLRASELDLIISLRLRTSLGTLGAARFVLFGESRGGPRLA